MGLFDLFGGFSSSGLGFLGQYLNVGYQKQLQENAGAVNYKYAEKTARNQPIWNRAGLESAGYNPMLAVQNATSGASAGWTSSGQVSPFDLSGNFSNGVANAQSFQRLKNETDTAKSQIESNEATAENQRAEAANARAHNPYISKRQEAEIGQIGAQTSKLRSDTEYNHALMDNLKQRQALDQYLGEMGLNIQRENNRIQSYNASTARKNYELENLRYAGSNDVFMSNYAKNHPHLYGVYRHLDNTAGLAGRVFGASSSFNNHETVEKVNFDRYGTFKGYSRTTRHKRHK